MTSGEKRTLYVSRPQYVEAIQWTGDNPSDVYAFCPNSVEVVGTTDISILAGKDGAQGWVPVPLGHWIVHPPEDLSDVWPVEDGYFRAKYEAAPSGSQPLCTCKPDGECEDLAYGPERCRFDVPDTGRPT